VKKKTNFDYARIEKLNEAIILVPEITITTTITKIRTRRNK